VTAIVGVLCKDGVVLGADSSTTFVAGEQFRTIEQQSNKVAIIGPQVIVAGTGAVGLSQRFGAVVQKAVAANIFDGDKLEAVKAITRAAIQDFQQTFARMGQYGALAAFCSQDHACLCEFALEDFQPELKTDEGIWYCSMGSTQFMTDPFLGLMRDVFWRSGPPPVSEGVFAVIATLEHAIALNPGGVKEPVQVAVLKREANGAWHARLLAKEECYEHSQSVRAARQHLRDFRSTQQPAAAAGLPAVPKA
jgi:hypothetical protein